MSVHHGNEARIRSFVDLGPGWEGPPIAADVIERALRLVGALVSEFTWYAVPCGDGGILFEGTGAWDGCDAKVEP